MTLALTPRTEGTRVAEFIESFCRPSKGGQLLQLRAWQHDLINELFALDENGRRIYRQALIGMPRKNGKSTLGAALALYALLMDRDIHIAPEVYSVAGDRMQAGIVFREAKAMIEADPDLAEQCRVYRQHIEVPSTGAVYRVLSADAPRAQGLNPTFVVFDEVHVQPNEDLWHAMTLGMGARAQPMIVGITTAGFDTETLAGRLYEHGKAVRAGSADDPTFFFRWWEPSREGADWRSEDVWQECNPAYGDFLYTDSFEADVRSTPEFEFRRFRLNQWTGAEHTWVESGMWEACEDKNLQLDRSLPVGVGVDKGQTHDTAAVVVAQKQGERVVVRSRVWENPYPPTHTLHNAWEVPSEEIREHLRELHTTYPKAQTVDDYGRAAPGPSFAYDPWHFSESAEILAQDRLQMTKFPQTHQFMGPASTQTFELIKGQRLVHDGDPVLSQHVRNATAELTPRGWKVSKPKKSTAKKNDAAVALVMAVSQALLEPPMPREKRKTRLPVGF